MQSKSKIVLSKHTCCALSCRVARYMESHPARVRESKCGKCDYLGNPNVASHAGARIETFQRHVHAVLFWSRALRGCANRNGKAKAAKTISGLRTSRGCANRNSAVSSRALFSSVALCTGARIEIWQMRLPWQSKCRTSRGVRIKTKKCSFHCISSSAAPPTGARIKTLRAVDNGANIQVVPYAGARIKIPFA